jgi:dsDNA-specific endonuclease/ATPase MutS2
MFMRDENLEQDNFQEEEGEADFPEIVKLPLEDILDLHTFLPKEIPDLVEDYIQQAYQAGFKQVRIIHGKGKGVQRAIVHSLLKRNPYVEALKVPPLELGGWGATLVILKGS